MVTHTARWPIDEKAEKSQFHADDVYGAPQSLPLCAEAERQLVLLTNRR